MRGFIINVLCKNKCKNKCGRFKNTSTPIAENDLPEVFRYIGGVIRSSTGISYMVGGMPDHIHVLTSLPHTICLSDFVRTIKANTSRWIKGLNSLYKDFSWQAGYGAFSVSESCKETVTRYIVNQKEHHQKVSAHDEFLHFLEKINSNTGEAQKNKRAAI